MVEQRTEVMQSIEDVFYVLICIPTMCQAIKQIGKKLIIINYNC